VRQTIYYGGPKIPQTGLQQLYRWEEWLQPRSIPECLQLIVSIPPWGDVARDEHKRFSDRAAEKAEALAEECARDPHAWLEHIEVVLQGEQRQARAFGRRLGQCLEEPEALINEALKVLARLNRTDANPLVLAAFLGSLKATHTELVERTLDAVANHQHLRSYLNQSS
jgi:hypothetical protein